MSSTTTTTSNSLAERYVHATLRSVPEARRDEIGRELRSSIADMVEARTANGEPADHAERAVLTELGDPGALAAQYADRPLHLIGPRYFLTYWRLLLKLLTWLPVSVALVVLTIEMIRTGDSPNAIGDAVGAGVQVALHVVFWTTLAFAILERVDVDPGLPGWTVDDLPDVQEGRQVTFVDTVASVVFLVVLGVVLVGQNFRSWVRGPSGDDVAVLDPDLWSAGWLPLLLGVLVVNIGLEVWKYRAGRWTWPIAGLAVAVSAAFALPVAWLASQDALFNPAFVDAVGMSDRVLGYVADGIVAGAVVVVLAAVGEAVWKVREGRRLTAAA